MVPIRQTLIKMGWPKNTTPIQTDNSVAQAVETTPSSHARSSPWTCDSTGSVAIWYKANFVFTGPQAILTRATTARNTTCPPTTEAILLSLKAVPSNIYNQYTRTVTRVTLICWIHDLEIQQGCVVTLYLHTVVTRGIYRIH